jgi:regulator of chromosome condensation
MSWNLFFYILGSLSYEIFTCSNALHSSSEMILQRGFNTAGFLQNWTYRSKKTVARLNVYTWGIGGARVARPSNPSATPPSIVNIPPHVSVSDVIQLSLSGHSALLLRSGELLTAGRNDSAGGGGRGSPPILDSGQLGRGGDTNSPLPVVMPRSVKIIASSCGRYHTIALTSSGDVYTFGLNDRGQLGRIGISGSPSHPCGCDSGGNCNCSSDFNLNTEPGRECLGGSTCRSGVAAKVLFDKKALKLDRKCKDEGGDCTLNMRASALAAGRYSSATIFEDGTLVVWGLIACGTATKYFYGNSLNNDGDIRSRLLSDPEFAASPRVISPDPPLKHGVKFIDVALGYVHLVALASDGSVHTCATGFDGYAGIVTGKFQLSSGLGRAIGSEVEGLQLAKVSFNTPNDFFTEISAGRCHVLVRNDKGEVFSWGCARKTLGRANGEQEVPSRVKGEIEREYIVSVASGEYFSLVSSRAGKVYGWGSSSNGQLGQIFAKDQESPLLIENIEGKVIRVSAGYQHAGAIVHI